MKTVIIVAMTRSGVIGKDGRIPWHDSEDLKHFKRVTTGHAVIMGRKTFDSIGKPLPGRRNIVITRNAETPKRNQASVGSPRPTEGPPDLSQSGDGPTQSAIRNPQSAIGNQRSAVSIQHSAIIASSTGSLNIVHSLDDALALCRCRNEEKAFIIGGGQIYQQALPIADEMIVTWIDRPDISGDTFFPDWKPSQWTVEAEDGGEFPRAVRYRRRET